MQSLRVLWHANLDVGRVRRGTIGLVAALACLPLVYVSGCAVDCVSVAGLRGQLQAAADAASAGSVAKQSPALRAAFLMPADGPIVVGATDAANIFSAGLSGVTGYSLDGMTATVAKRGDTVTSEVSFSAKVPTPFLRVIGWRFMTVTGTSTATAKLSRHIDIYVPSRQFAAD